MEAKRIKKYVQVTADFFTDGRLRPLDLFMRHHRLAVRVAMLKKG